MNADTQSYCRVVLCARILIEDHLPRITPTTRCTARLRIMRPGDKPACPPPFKSSLPGAVSYLIRELRPTINYEFTPRTSISCFILNGVTYGRCPHDPGTLRVIYPREGKARLPVQLEPDRLRQERRKAPPTRRFLKDDQQSRLESASQGGWWPEEGRAVRSQRCCKV